MAYKMVIGSPSELQDAFDQLVGNKTIPGVRTRPGGPIDPWKPILITSIPMVTKHNPTSLGTEMQLVIIFEK